MTAFKLFISHSSRLDDPEISNDPDQNPNLKLLLDVIQDIKKEYGDAIEILVDKDEKKLPAGHDWEKRLNEWLAECHAAVILFSKRAIETSNWVKKEATILSWRRELERDFTVIPVLLEDQATIADLQKDLFGVLKILKSECHCCARNSKDIVNKIKIGLGEKITLPNDTPFNKLERVIASLLAENVSSISLQNTWNSLDGQTKLAWSPSSSVKFSHALTRYLFQNGDSCFNNFISVIDSIRPKIEHSRALELFEYIRSLWVNPSAAGRIPASLNHEKFVVQNGSFLLDFTLKRYLERAWPMTKKYLLVDISADSPEKIFQQIRLKFSYTKQKPQSDEQCDRNINNSLLQIVFFIPDCNDNEGLIGDYRTRDMLRTAYPKAIFVLGSGQFLPPIISNDLLKVEPPLDLELETDQMSFYGSTEQFLANFYAN